MRGVRREDRDRESEHREGALALPDLTPRGRTIIDLLGHGTAEEWTPWGSCYAMLGPPTEEERVAFHQAYDDAERITKRLTRAECLEVTDRLGMWVPSRRHGDIHMMRARLMNRLMDLWFPKQFVNARAPHKNTDGG